MQATAEAALKKLVPYNLEEFEKVYFHGGGVLIQKLLVGKGMKCNRLMGLKVNSG